MRLHPGPDSRPSHRKRGRPRSPLKLPARNSQTIRTPFGHLPSQNQTGQATLTRSCPGNGSGGPSDTNSLLTLRVTKRPRFQRKCGCLTELTLPVPGGSRSKNQQDVVQIGSAGCQQTHKIHATCPQTDFPVQKHATDVQLRTEFVHRKLSFRSPYQMHLPGPKNASGCPGFRKLRNTERFHSKHRLLTFGNVNNTSTRHRNRSSHVEGRDWPDSFCSPIYPGTA